MKNVMVDLETLSSRSNGCIVAIGAVEFDVHGGTLGREFYVNVLPDERFHISGDTFLWWLQQSAEARNALVNPPGCAIDAVLQEFSDWYPRGALLWGNGATFDNVLLRHAYLTTGIRCPWHFRDDRCFRTMKAALPQVEWPQGGTKHNALDDARCQAQYLISAMQASKKTK